MNFRLKRFLEFTIPVIILYGLSLVIGTYFVGAWFGISCIVIFSIIDVVMLRKLAGKNNETRI